MLYLPAAPIRLKEKIIIHPKSRCWIWTGTLSFYGYGTMVINTKSTRVHRFSYEIHKGKIPEGLVIDHLCRNKKCVNPEHLEAVTGTENLRRGKEATKTHCKRGHPLVDRQRNGDRYCKKCATYRARINYHKRRCGKAP